MPGRGLSWSRFGFPNVVVEGDSKIVISKCNVSTMDKPHLSAYISDIQHRKSCFRSLTFRDVLRVNNQLAHQIPSKSLKTKEEIYLGDVQWSWTDQENQTKGF